MTENKEPDAADANNYQSIGTTLKTGFSKHKYRDSRQTI